MPHSTPVLNPPQSSTPTPSLPQPMLPKQAGKWKFR
jgi:hypothetical protein